MAYLMNNVVITSIVVKFTVNAASKKKDLKKVVAKVIPKRRNDGRKVVKSSLVSRLLKRISIFNPWLTFPAKRNLGCRVKIKNSPDFM